MPNSLPFSPARIAGNLLFLSGQVGIKDGKLVADDIRSQTAQAVENIVSLLAAQNCTLENVVDITAFIVDQNDYPIFNEVYAEYFKEPFPTRTTVTVKSLPLNARVELKVVANTSR